MGSNNGTCEECGAAGSRYDGGRVLCKGHALMAGFCPGCGSYVGYLGAERRNLLQEGLCLECAESWRDEGWDGTETARI